ncbi:MAG: hypothetical protein K9K67_03375 [Bacteriovoracaceae bacterium]|nr:hypothetical protein [Bacteriovoracaceae bacterium]
MKRLITISLFLMTYSAWADLQLLTSVFYDPSSSNTGSGTSSSGGTLTGTETSETTLTYRLDAFNRLPSGLKFGYGFGSMVITKEETSGSAVTTNSSTIIFHGPAIGYDWSRWSLTFFYYLGARESREELSAGVTTEYEYRDSSGYEINLGYSFPLGRRVAIGARLSRRSLSQKEVGVKASGATTETAYTLSEGNSRVTNQILFALDFRFF